MLFIALNERDSSTEGFALSINKNSSVVLKLLVNDSDIVDMFSFVSSFILSSKSAYQPEN